MKGEFENKVLVALGGNAILKHRDRGTAAEQMDNVRSTSKVLAQIISNGYRLAITHGNGPQVGDILLRNELSKDSLPPMPLDFCGAESQGMIGYMLQQSLTNDLKRIGRAESVLTVLTQTLVDKDSPAFNAPTKPIGPFYTADQAERLRNEKGWAMMEDAGRGFRRMVPSPMPLSIVEGRSIRNLFQQGYVVIACGGGGVPVVRDGATLIGIEAVIDKDHSAAVLGRLIGVSTLLILTDVSNAYLDYGKTGQRPLGRVSLKDAERYLAAGHFRQGSMAPKIESGINFVKKGGTRAIITSMEFAIPALEYKAGTILER
jgi:carbamate kinase